MKIEGLGPIDPLKKINKPHKAVQAKKPEQGDSVSLSEEARNKAELLKVSEAVRNAPEVRMDRVAEVKAKLEDPSYIDDRIVEATADKIMDMFGL